MRKLTGGIGVDRAIDAVGVDAMHAHHAPAAQDPSMPESEQETARLAPHAHPTVQGNWVPGDAPAQALDWAIRALAKASTLSIIGVYSPTAQLPDRRGDEQELDGAHGQL